MLYNYIRKTFSWLIFLFLLTTGNVVAQTNYDTIFTLNGFQRDAYLGELMVHIKDQPKEISKLKSLIHSKGTEADKWQMNLMTEIGYAPFPDSINEAVLNIYEKHLGLAEKLNNHYFQAKIYFIIGDYYNHFGFKNESFQNKLYCLDELEKDPTGNYYEQSWWLHQIATSYYEFEDYKKSLALSKIGFSLNGIRSPNQGWFMKISSNLVGMSFLKDNVFDSAKTWFEKTYSLALNAQDTAWLGIATGNIGSTYFKQERYNEAIPFYEKALPLCRTKELWDNISPFCCNLAICYMETGNGAGVLPLLIEAQKANDLVYNLPNFIRYYSTLAKYYRKNGNAALALQSLDSLSTYQMKAEVEYDTNKKNQLEAQLAYNYKLHENEIAEQKIKSEVWIRYGLLTTLILLAIIGWLFYKRQRLRHKFKQEHLENEKLNAELELSLALSEIRDFTQIVKDKNEMLFEIITEMEFLKKQNQGITSDQLLHIEQLQQSVDLTDEEWNKFSTVIEKLYPGYLTP